MFEFSILLLASLLTRMAFLPHNKSRQLWQAISKILIEFGVVFLFGFSGVTFALAGALLLINLLAYYLERQIDVRLVRLASLIDYCIVFLVFTSDYLVGGLDGYFYEVFFGFFLNHTFFRQILSANIENTLLFLCGFILCAKEISCIIGLVLDSLQMDYGGEGSNNLGRLIGVLERFLIYGFTIIGSPIAIGLILSAKGIARFRKLENKDFAEYFLIGTLLSATIAGSIGLLVRSLI